MVLKSMTLNDRGVTISIELGDLLPVKAALVDQAPGGCSSNRTRDRFMITVGVGPCSARLYPHEFSPIDFFTIMAMKKDGEVEEQFVSQDDATGYFAPTAGVRSAIRAAFGER